jgi:response regulator of citrate/malate metabolism
MKEVSIAEDIREIQSIISRLEDVTRNIEEYQKTSNLLLDSIKNECNSIMSDAKTQLHQTFVEAEKYGFEPVPDVHIEDKKLKNAWITLYRHHDGATADTIAEELHRHRTTVSTYLNYLVLMGYAKKKRVGHVIYYTAVLMKQKGTSE